MNKMKKENETKVKNNIRVQMIRMIDNFVPYVKVDYMDKDAKEHTGLMMVDSGTDKSILADEMAERCLLKKKEGVITFCTVSGDIVETSNVEFSFVLGNHQFHDDFCLCEDFHKTALNDKSIIGIIGTNFLRNHNLVIDYADGSLHTSNVNPSNLSIADCNYFFPMEIGFKSYGLPVVAIRQNDVDLVMVADTGATDNMIAVQSLRDNGFKHSYLDSKDIVSGLNGNIEVDQATVDFNLLTLDENNNEYEVCHHDLFKVAPDYLLPSDELSCDENGEPFPPVDGLISSEFMAKQGWVLDFGAMIIYKR